ncbi:MAG: Fe-S cluster domain-containing protein [Elusimicrobia bacterium]|nr:Fe-S cluster domain-containing protein [Elusimicrobiota bacterium]
MIIPLLVLGLLGLLMGAGLAIASKRFAVQIDPRIEKITEILPGANCGACGFAGCMAYAKAVVEGTAKPGACPVGGEPVSKEISSILGIEISEQQKLVARVHCGGNTSERRQKGIYEGVKTCLSATLISGGTVSCNYGCIGFGDCVYACPFGAIKFNENLPPEIDEEKCTSCGLCVKACPKNLIKLVPKDKRFIVACSSHDKGRIVKQVCDVGCIGCGLCVKKCPEKAIVLEKSLSKIDYTKCKNTGECFKVCPTKCIQWKR